VSNTPGRSRHFGLPIPNLGSIRSGQDLIDWMTQAETTMGCNTNLVLTADTGAGIAQQYTLAHMATESDAQKADPSDGRWGRLLLQETMVNGEEVMGRLIGISTVGSVSGIAASVEDGATVYHDADSNTLTVDPDDAVVAGADDRIYFLPLGFAFEGGAQVFFVGNLPLQVCPSVQTGKGIEYKPGLNDPAGSWTDVLHSSAPAQQITFGAGAVTESIDLYLPFVVPADFDRWLDKDTDAFWAALISFITTGNGALAVVGIVGTDGAEVAITGVTGTSVGSYSDLVLRQKKLYDAGATMTPSGIAYLRLRASGHSSAVVRVRPTAPIQYFPLVTWS
jgi:hypothetical protein